MDMTKIKYPYKTLLSTEDGSKKVSWCNKLLPFKAILEQDYIHRPHSYLLKIAPKSVL